MERTPILYFWGIFLLFVMCKPFGLMAQSNGDEPQAGLNPQWFMDYDFVRYDLNEIKQFSPDALKHVFQKMARLETSGDSRVHILHIGDSHIQADIISGHIREKFMADPRFPVNSRGLVFPYRTARTNNPFNYKVYTAGSWEGKKSVKSRHFSEWGLTAITAETNDANAAVTILPLPEDGTFQTTRVKVLYPNTANHAFEPYFIPEEGSFVESYMVAGGYVEYTFDKPQQQIQLKLQQVEETNEPFVLQGLFLDNMEPGLIYSSTGLNGAEVGTYLRCQQFEEQIRMLKPDLVIVSLGTNDAYMYAFNEAAFKQDYLQLLRKIERAMPQASILLTTPGDGYRRRRYANKNNERARNVIEEIAAEKGLAMWDLYSTMGGYQSINEWYGKGLAQRDKLHYTSKGYRLQGELFYLSFDRAYQAFRQYRMMGK